MPEWSFNYRRPVRRAGAQEYVLLSLISFGGSVIFTRLFLELTGYPQLGGGDLHIAHVLWGGLILFAAAILPLVLANRWALHLSAILSGLGVGLFIDELGKFITTTNDYFYPPAAPIIYAFFLLTVLLYLRVRKPSNRKTRDELYRVLENMTEVLDHDLEPAERIALDKQLNWIAAQKSQPNLVRLAQALREFIRTEALDLAPVRLTPLQRAVPRNLSLAKPHSHPLPFSDGYCAHVGRSLAFWPFTNCLRCSKPSPSTQQAVMRTSRDWSAHWSSPVFHRSSLVSHPFGSTNPGGFTCHRLRRLVFDH